MGEQYNFGCPEGCTDPAADNYDPAAVGDGSCTFSIPCADVDLQLYDSWGDGWNGNALAMTDCAGNTLTGMDASYTLDNGDAGVHDICIPSDALDAGYIITAGVDIGALQLAGSWGSEISWYLFDADANVLAEG